MNSASSTPSFSRSCSLSTHDDTSSPYPVVFNPNLLPEDAKRCGRVLKVLPVADGPGLTTARQESTASSDIRDYAAHGHGDRGAQAATFIDDTKPLIFVVRDLDQNECAKHRNLQLSVSKQLAAVHGMCRGMAVLVADADEAEFAASHVELSFSDPLNRADLWKLTISELARRQCVYQGQELLFLGNIKIIVKKLFIDGRRAPSGFFTSSSKPIFRSTSARFIIGIQISQEMFEFDDDLSNTTLWSKATDFVATLLHRWKAKGTRHMLTIVLFARLHERNGLGPEGVPIDLYRVVASDLPDFPNNRVMRMLNKSFRSFAHEIRMYRSCIDDSGKKSYRDVATARRGNFLEAINVAISACWLDELDLDFERTGTSLVLVSPGCGSFEIDANLLKVTGDRLAGRSIGVELVCLSCLPFHVVPLFMLKNTLGGTPFLDGQNSTHDQPSYKNSSRFQQRHAPSSHDPYVICVMPTWIETSFYKTKAPSNAFNEQNQTSEAHRLVEKKPRNACGVLTSPTSYTGQSTSKLSSQGRTTYVGKGIKKPAPFMEEHDRQSFVSIKSSSGDLDILKHPQPNGHSVLSPTPRLATSDRALSPHPQRPKPSPYVSSTTSVPTRGGLAKMRLSSLLGHSALQKANATVGSSVEQARSTTRRESSQDLLSDPNTVSGQLQMSLSRTSSASVIHSPAEIVGPQSDDQAVQRLESSSINGLDGALPRPDASEFNPNTATGTKERSLPTRMSTDMNARNPVMAHENLPWLIIRNPCRVEHETLDAFGEWNHAFTSERKAHAVKWKALCSPASLPLTTEHFPSDIELQTAFMSSSYKVSIIVNQVRVEDYSSRRGNLAREMVLYRISEGFQIAVGNRADRIIGPLAANAANFYADDFMGTDGAAVMMLKGDDVHVLCAAAQEVHVTKYTRKGQRPRGVEYPAHIRTYMDQTFSTRPLTFNARDERDWSKLDHEIRDAEAYAFDRDVTMPIKASHARLARFVLIPVDLPTAAKQPHLGSEETDEELRLDGIRKLTMLWQKNRWVSPEDERHHTSWRSHKDINPLAIEYQTRDPSAIVAAGFESAILTEGESTAAMTHLFDEDEQYRTSHVDIQKLAGELQSERGINVRPRRWHLRLYEYCFVGHDLTTFLLARFQDMETREQAVEFGNVLMHDGLFRHVNNKHQFRDGNYFFTIMKEYRGPKPEVKSTWLNVRKALASVPATPLSEGPKDMVDPFAAYARGFPTKRPTVTLSGAIQFNVDAKRVSTRPEIITIHYDRLHNPENAFHFMLEWTNATAKLVEDALTSWAVHVSRFGLKLVQVPIAEAVVTPQINPLRSPYMVEMALKAAPAPPTSVTDSPMLQPQRSSNAKHFQKELLKKFDFVLDFEASSSFPSEVETTYSYGQDVFHHDQYIHRSGLLLAEIVEDWKFIVIANRLCSSRIGPARSAERLTLSESLGRPKTSPLPRHTSTAALSAISDMTLSPIYSHHAEHKRNSHHSDEPKSRTFTRPFGRPGEQVLEDFEKFCHSEDALREFYEEASRQTLEKPTPALSAISAAQTPSMKPIIPSLDLPEPIGEDVSAI